MSEIQESELVTLTIDGIEVSVPKGTTIIRAAESVGIAIPRFCDHPLLDPRGSCRQCLVEIPDAGNGRGFPAPQTSCTMTVAPGMVVKTQRTSEPARAGQEGIMELLLVNHPLDCPVCDKGGECPLQNQAMSAGRAHSRFTGQKRRFPKPLPISAQILLDRERCVLCARCTRFAEEVAGDPFIALVGRGAAQQVGEHRPQSFVSYFSGNVVQLCPVGALTAKSYRFNARPFDLVSTETVCEHCASGCALRVDQRHGDVRRRLAGADPAVNEEWNCDKGRFAFRSAKGDDRLTHPLVRENGALRPASWPEALQAAAAGLAEAGGSVGVLTGGRLTRENAYAYSKFARTVLGTNSIDFRSRPHSDEETSFLAAKAAVQRPDTPVVTYADLQTAAKVVLVAFEPEDESPMVFLRLRKAVRKRGLKVVTVSAVRSYGSNKLDAEFVPALPGAEAAALAGLELDADTVVLVGERAALSPGLLGAVAASGARWAWIPRRAGEVGAVEAGCLPNVLPGGRPVSVTAARVDAATVWGVDSLPDGPGLSADGMVAAVNDGSLAALVTAGIDPTDFAAAKAVRSALGRAFTVSLETRLSAAAQFADVVLPVALAEEQSGTFVDWEHRPRALRQAVPSAQPNDLRVLAALAKELGTDLGLADTAAAQRELAEFEAWEGELVAPPEPPPPSEPPEPSGPGLRLASWRELLDASSALDGALELQKSAPQVKTLLSPATAARLGLATGDLVRVSGPDGAVLLPLEVSAKIVDDAVWAPGNAPGAGLGFAGITVTQVVDVARWLIPGDAEASGAQGVRSQGGGGRRAGSTLTDDNAASVRHEGRAARSPWNQASEEEVGA
jgi:NADH-quinone oxidoreductase subunit G